VKNIITAFLLFSSVFSQSLSFSSNGTVAIYPISPGARGADLVNMFTTLNSSPFRLAASQIAIQTTKNGLIPNVQFITPMTNFTILVIGYWLPNDQPPVGLSGGRVGSTTRFGYIALPVEQIVEMIYSPTTITQNSVFTSQAMGGTLPIFSVDLAQRSADIIQAVNLLITPPIANTGSAFTPVSLQTSVNGPFYGIFNESSQLFTHGLIPRIISISAVSPNSTLLLVQFKPFRTSTLLASGQIATVVIAPEQVNGILFAQ
jgi:hypothetical protein